LTAAASALLLCFLLVQCSGPAAGRLDPAQFEQWFVGTAATPALLFRTIGIGDLRDVADSLRRTGRAGRFTATLSDTFGMPYSVGYQTPRALRGDTLYPCIIYLHGGTGSVATNKGDSAYLMFAMLADSMDLFLVSPSANRMAPWWSPAGLSRILQTLRFISARYPVDPQRVILAGVSDGATGCWAAANTIYAPFAGFIAVSGFGGMLPQLGMALRTENLMQRPVYNVNAGLDRLYPVDVVTMFLDSMERAGVGVLRKVYPEEQHGFDYRMLECGTLCSLVREWKLPGGPALQAVGSSAYPLAIDHCLSLEPAAGASEYAIRGYCRNDTFFLYTSGLNRLLMYFDSDDRCAAQGRITINTGAVRTLKKTEPDAGILFTQMKKSCSPLIHDRIYYSILF
jgi:acetyl esterase/lipase